MTDVIAFFDLDPSGGGLWDEIDTSLEKLTPGATLEDVKVALVEVRMAIDWLLYTVEQAMDAETDSR